MDRPAPTCIPIFEEVTATNGNFSRLAINGVYDATADHVATVTDKSVFVKVIIFDRQSNLCFAAHFS
jgi:hypothetical protein